MKYSLLKSKICSVDIHEICSISEIRTVEPSFAGLFHENVKFRIFPFCLFGNFEHRACTVQAINNIENHYNGQER